MSARPQFPGQHPDEKVILKLRRHWFVLLTSLIPPLLLLIATVGIGIGIGLALNLSLFIWAGLIFFLSLAPLGLAIWRFLDWENDHYFLTDRRVLHIERIYFLFEQREEASLDKIQNVTVRMTSLISNLLNFGDVEIETAGTEGRIVFRAVPNPRKVQQMVFRQAGLPEPDTEDREERAGNWLHPLRPFYTLHRMLYAAIPHGSNVYVWRKHWIALIQKIIRPLLIGLFLLIVWLIILFSPLAIAIPFVPEMVIKVIPGIIFLLDVIWLVWLTIDWRNDVYVLTETHVIDIEKRPFTLEVRREADLNMIQNAGYEQPSFLAKLLDYGNIRLETAGTMGELTFDTIPHPRDVQEKIMERLNQINRAKAKTEPAPKTREDLEKLVAEILKEQYGLNPPAEETGA